MKTTNKVLLSSALALAVAGIGTAHADGKMKMEMKKCYGVVKAGANDCKTATGSCAGSSVLDGDKTAFIVLKKGVCEKLVGGLLEPGTNEEKKDS